jgi:hypothetical protein
MRTQQDLAGESRPPDSDLGFAPGTKVKVEQIGDRRWATLDELTYVAKRRAFTVKRGFQTDFASVPRYFVWLFPASGRYTKAAILHDYLCGEPVDNDEISRGEADGIFRQAMRTLEVAFLRRWLMWAGVRIGALGTKSGRKHWFRHSWQLLPLLLIALPVVAPPAVTILTALAVFYVMERVVYLVLRHSGQPAKKVNEPRLQLEL